jgi:hypothetical protein
MQLFVWLDFKISSYYFINDTDLNTTQYAYLKSFAEAQKKQCEIYETIRIIGNAKDLGFNT